MDRQPIHGRFGGQVAIVTGGASGIGRAVATELAREGAAVAIADLSPAGAAFAAELQAAGGQALYLPGDLADEAVCAGLVAQTVAHFGRLDCLVNNAFSFIAKGLDAGDKELAKSIALRIVQNLNQQDRRGTVRKDGKRGGVCVWRLR